MQVEQEALLNNTQIVWKVRVSKRKKGKLTQFYFFIFFFFVISVCLFFCSELARNSQHRLNRKIILILDMALAVASRYVFSLHTSMKSAENKAESVRQVFTIGYVVFKHVCLCVVLFCKRSVCVLRHNISPIYRLEIVGCEKLFTFIFSPTTLKHITSIIWIISFISHPFSFFLTLKR